VKNQVSSCVHELFLAENGRLPPQPQSFRDLPQVSSTPLSANRERRTCNMPVLRWGNVSFALTRTIPHQLTPGSQMPSRPCHLPWNPLPSSPRFLPAELHDSWSPLAPFSSRLRRNFAQCPRKRRFQSSRFLLHPGFSGQALGRNPTPLDFRSGGHRMDFHFW